MHSIESFTAAEAVAHGSFQKIPRIEVIFKLDTCGEALKFLNFSGMAHVVLNICISVKPINRPTNTK